MTTEDYRWIFVDVDGNSYNLSNKSAKVLDDGLSIETDIIERSFRAGAVLPGIQRDESKEFTIQVNVDYPTEAAFDTYVNTLVQKARACILLQDNVMQREVEAVLNNWAITYDEGAFKHGSLINLTFVILKPYWQDIQYTTITETGATEEFTIINDGYIETPPIITLTAFQQTTKFIIYINETRKGILINDLQFGVAGNNTYIIDCVNGTAELNGIPREDTIKSGTGFFNIPVGTSTLILETNGLVESEIKYKRRYYI